MCCSPWGPKELDMTEWLNNNNNNNKSPGLVRVKKMGNMQVPKYSIFAVVQSLSRVCFIAEHKVIPSWQFQQSPLRAEKQK